MLLEVGRKSADCKDVNQGPSIGIVIICRFWTPLQLDWIFVGPVCDPALVLVFNCYIFDTGHGLLEVCIISFWNYVWFSWADFYLIELKKDKAKNDSGRKVNFSK